jgi:hypothetical protein
MDSEFVKKVHKCTAGSRKCTSVLQAAETLCPEISSFSISSNAIVDCGMTWWELHSVSLKKRVKMWWHVSVVIDGSADVTDTDYLALFIQVVSENCPYKTGP